METNSARLGGYIERVRQRRPIVHHIMNHVTANDCANVSLALGARPIMAECPKEAADVASRADALVLNMGTPNDERTRAMTAAGAAANRCGIPVLLDPVGVGFTAYRAEVAREILRVVRPSAIRGNASEIRALAGEGAGGNGVDTSEVETENLADKISAAGSVAARHCCVAIATGEVDVVTDGCRTALIRNGHPSMARVSGTGCMCDSLIAALAGAGADMFEAAICGVSVMGIAGERAFARAGHLGTGSLRTAIVDEISLISPDIAKQYARFEVRR